MAETRLSGPSLVDRDHLLMEAMTFQGNIMLCNVRVISVYICRSDETSQSTLKL